MEPQEPVLNGVSCDVTNCVYNNGCSQCTAGEIHVRNKADAPEESVCETFSEI